MATTFNIKKLKYDIDQVLDHFALERSTHCPSLAALLGVTVSQSFVLPAILEEQRKLLETEGDLWNEEELKMHFLSPLFLVAKFQIPKKMKLFYERPIAGKVRETEISVICDAFLASPLGINTPKKPYFFLQEFKKGKKSQDDAEGQMLIAMLIAQELNKDDNPVYGCYLQGRYWYFSTLLHDNYCLSRSFDATQPLELAQIIHILQNLKNIIKF